MSTFDIGQAYSFDLYASAVLGAGYTNATVDAILSPSMASRDIDIQAVHVSVYADLPSGTPNDPTQYNYVRFITSAGNPITLGIPWIKASTIALAAAQTITATIANVGPADMARINNALIANGYTAFQLNISPAPT